MEHKKKGIARYLELLELGVVTILISTIIVSIFVQVLSRYVFTVSISWLEELARFAFIWAALYGGSIAYRRGVLHKFEIPFDKISSGLQRGINIVTKVLVLFFLGVLIVFGMKLSIFVYNQFSPALSLRMTYIYLAVPVSAAMMFAATVNTIVRSLFKEKVA